MKIIITILLTLCLSTHAMAECRGSGIYIIAPSLSLNRTSIIVIEFYHSSQSLIKNLNKKYPIYLKSKNNKTPLLIKEILKGDFEVTQVVFQSLLPLSLNDTYNLVIDNLPGFEIIYVKHNGSFDENKKVTWNVSEQINNNLFWEFNPLEIKKTRVEYGCGPAEWVYFKLQDNISETFVKVFVRNISTGKTTVFIVPLENGTIKVGHGMCGGGFTFEDSNNFELRISSLSTSSNTLTKPVSFLKPTASTNEE